MEINGTAATASKKSSSNSSLLCLTILHRICIIAIFLNMMDRDSIICFHEQRLCLFRDHFLTWRFTFFLFLSTVFIDNYFSLFSVKNNNTQSLLQTQPFRNSLTLAHLNLICALISNNLFLITSI